MTSIDRLALHVNRVTRVLLLRNGYSPTSHSSKEVNCDTVPKRGHCSPRGRRRPGTADTAGPDPPDVSSPAVGGRRRAGQIFSTKFQTAAAFGPAGPVASVPTLSLWGKGSKTICK